jgi:CRP-like cAMP-binding protein
MHNLHSRSPLTKDSDVPTQELHENGQNLEVEPFLLFKGLRKQEVAAIRNAAVTRTFRISEIIVTADEPALHFFLLQKGLVDYFVETKEGRQIMLGRLIPGDPFGFAALLSNPTGYLATATGVREAEALVWKHHIIHQLAATYPRLVENALRIGLHYIALYTKRHVRILSNNAQERVASALTNLASRTGHVYPDGLEVEVKNEELASLADVNSYSVSRFLRQWNREGTVKKSRGKILVQRPEHLISA